MSKTQTESTLQLIKFSHFKSTELMHADPTRVETSVIEILPEMEAHDPDMVFKLRNIRIL